jgi:Leucine-rich repeat (LRR) protein
MSAQIDFNSIFSHFLNSTLEMEKVVFFLILTLFSVTVNCAGLSCVYHFHSDNGYTCDLNINNPNGFDNFTQITGTHQNSETDLTVDAIKITEGNSAIAPKIICEKFKNLKQIYYSDPAFERITSSSFSACTKVDYIWLKYVSVIEANAFDNMKELTRISIAHSKITTLPSGLFDNAPKLYRVYISYNSMLTSLPSAIFAKNLDIEQLLLHNNKLQTWHPQWSQSKTKLLNFWAQGNNFTVAPYQAINSSVLKSIDISLQKIQILNSTSFGDLSKVKEFHSRNNSVKAIDIRIVNQARNLKSFSLIENSCIQTNFNNFHLNRDAYMEMLQPCFEAFGIVNLGKLS